MKKHRKLFSVWMIILLLFPNFTVPTVIEASSEQETDNMIDIKNDDWQGSVFGDVGGQDKITAENFSIIENDDGSVRLRSANNRGKIASSSEGLAYYFTDIPRDGNFTFSATATVESWDANNQVGFGLMLRSNVLDNEHVGDSFTGDYLAVGNVRQEMRGFYKYSDENYQHPDSLKLGDAPVVGEQYELSIEKYGNSFIITIDGQSEVIEYTGEINYAGLFTSRNTTVLFSDITLEIEGEVDLGDWSFSVFGENTGDEEINPEPILNDDGSVTLEANGGKISSSVDGISYYYKQLSAEDNFEIKTTAVVNRFGANNQVSFGIMLRDEVGEHRNSSGHEANYVSVGALDQSIRGFYKVGNQQKLPVFDPVIPSEGATYDLAIRKSGDVYELSINGESYETITQEGIFTDDLYVGIFVARDTSVTFYDTDIVVETRSVERLEVDATDMKTEYLQDEPLDLSGLKVTAIYSDGESAELSENDYIVTGFDSSEVGTITVTIHYLGTTESITVEILPLTITDLAIRYYPAKTTYYKDDLFNPLGLVVEGIYNDGYQVSTLSEEDYTIFIDGANQTEAGYQLEDAGIFDVVIVATESNDVSTSFEIEVLNVDLVGLEIRREPQKTQYFIGDELNLSGLSIYAIYDDGSEVRLMSNEYEVFGFDTDTVGEKEVVLTHKGETVTLTLPVKEPEVTGIEVTEYPKTTYYLNELFNSEGLVVSKVYDNGDREALSEDEFTLDESQFDSTKVGTYELEIIPTDDSLSPISLAVSVREEPAIEWKWIRFGQSTSTERNKIEFLEDDVIRIIAEEGGGKVTGDHDGITFYYTEIDANQDNFVLSADIFVEEYAKTPHDGQESFGIMARDILGPANDSGVYASNIAAVGGYSGGTRNPNGTQLFVRTGVLSADGEGSEGIQSVMLKNERPNAENTKENYRLTLAKTNSGFVGVLNDGPEAIIYEPDILTVQDSDTIYVGFYTARLATIQVSNIEMTITDANTDPPRLMPPEVPVEPKLEVLSLNKTSETDYTLMLETNVDGVVSVKQGQEYIHSYEDIKAGEVLALDTEIAAMTNTNFSISFLPDDTQLLTDYDLIVENFTVENRIYEADDGNIYVSPDGTSDGDGSRENPLDLDTAIEFVQKGQKIIVQEGVYLRNSKLEIKKYNDGEEGKMKYLIADPEANERPLIDFDKRSEGVVHSGDYWHVEGIDFARSAGNTKGYTLGGSYNVIRNISTFEHGDTGFQISRTDITEDDFNEWPAYNLVENSISYDNRDPSENNADGFAAKLTVGEGNVFRGNVAHHNIDDGWDLYAKVGTGAIGTVIIENSIAFNNGRLTTGHQAYTDMNGFKLGGEGIHVPHVIRNSLAFGNGAYGFTSNSNPGVIAEHNIAYNNGDVDQSRANFSFTTYSHIETDFHINGFASIQTDGGARDVFPDELASDINYMFDGERSVNASGEELLVDQLLQSLEQLFIYNDEGEVIDVKRNEDGEIQWGDIWETYAEVVGVEIEDPTDPVDPDPTEPPTELEIELGDTVEVGAGQLVKVNDTAISIQMPADLPEGTTITITQLNHDEAVGDVIRVDLQLPEGEEGFEGEYLLTLGVDEEAMNKAIAIFYYNEETEEWKNVGGEIDRETQTISTTVNHFSTYGVFVDPPDSEEPIDPADPVPKDPTDPADDPESPDDGDDRQDPSIDDADKPTVEDESSTDVDEDDKDKKLPKTATNIYQLLAFGTLLVALGSILFIITLRRKQN